jgi:hypothetical protein
MKKIVIFSILCVAALSFLAGCKSSKKVVKEMPVAVVEDHASFPYAFKAGEFYTFDFTNPSVIGFNEKAAIQKLIDSGVVVTDIWYKSGASGCRPPGSDLVMTVMVDPALLLRLDKSDDQLLKLGYIKTMEPGLGDCAYTVRHYKF